jgi:hypothetical protein
MADIESAATTLSSRPVEALDQGEESIAPRDGAREARVLMIEVRHAFA